MFFEKLIIYMSTLILLNATITHNLEFHPIEKM
jgi:hypothetical protein